MQESGSQVPTSFKHYERPAWAFVRVAPEEQSIDLWRVIFDAIGGTSAEWQKFLRSKNSEGAAQVLEDVFVGSTPTLEIPIVRPDLLVVLGTG